MALGYGCLKTGFDFAHFGLESGVVWGNYLLFPHPLQSAPESFLAGSSFGQETDLCAYLQANRALIQNASWATSSFVLRVIGPLRTRDSLSGRWHGKGVHVDSIVVANGLRLIRPSDLISTGYFGVFFETAKETFHIAFFLFLGASEWQKKANYARSQGRYVLFPCQSWSYVCVGDSAIQNSQT